MAMVKIVSSRASCDRLYAGSILVKDNRIISSGYNGAPTGLSNCSEIGHLLEDGHCVRTIHAEHNAILQAAKLGSSSTVGTTMYSKYSPCIHCAKYVIAAGVKRVVIGKVYRNANVIDFLKEAKIEVDIYKENTEWSQELIKIFGEDIPERGNESAINMEGKM